jgi:hypothetical protein
VAINSTRIPLLNFRRFLEHDLNPAPAPSDAQIGMIMGYIERHFVPRLKTTRHFGSKVKKVRQIT